MTITSSLSLGVIYISLLALSSSGIVGCSSESGSVAPSTKMTLKGVLKVGTAGAALSKDLAERVLKNSASAAANYSIQAINATDGTIQMITAGSDGSFSADLLQSKSYVFNILDSNSNYQGMMVMDTSNPSTVATGFKTGTNSTFDMGNVTLNSTTGVATPSNSVTSVTDTTILAAATNGVPNGISGNGQNTNGINTATVNAIDSDGDGNPDVTDIDNKNDGLTNNINGVSTAYQCPRISTISLFIDNKVQVAGTATSSYEISSIVTPNSGKTIQSVTLSGPSYLGGLAYSDSIDYQTPITLGTAYDKKLVACYSGTFCMHLINGAAQTIASGLKAGDTYIYTINFTDGSSSTCSKTVNMILDKIPTSVTVAGSAPSSPTSFITVSGSTFSLTFTIPAGMPLGMTYSLSNSALVSKGSGNCSADPNNFGNPLISSLDTTFVKDTRTSASQSLAVSVNIPYTGSKWSTSSTSAWTFDVLASDTVGDNSAATGIRIKTSSSSCTTYQ